VVRIIKQNRLMWCRTG